MLQETVGEKESRSVVVSVEKSKGAKRERSYHSSTRCGCPFQTLLHSIAVERQNPQVDQDHQKLFLLAQQRAVVPPSHCMLSKRERRARTLPVSHSTNHKQIPSSLCSTHKNKDHRHSAQHGRRTVSQNYEEIDPSIVSPWTLPRLPVLALLLHASREYDGKKMVEVDDTTINQKNDSTLLDKNDKSRLPFFRGWGLYVINSPVKIGPTQ
jgi:hypothetical protein